MDIMVGMGYAEWQGADVRNYELKRDCAYKVRGSGSVIHEGREGSVMGGQLDRHRCWRWHSSIY